MFERGDIVEVYFDLPRATETKLHPAIILSNETVFDKEDIYVCVMMTSIKELDYFSFEIKQEMLDLKNNKDFSQARCHLITYVKKSTLKKEN